MNQEIIILLFSALSIGFIHTLVGVDHYLPFVVLAKARKWSITKATVITILCGLGHVLSALLLGMIAVSIGLTLNKLEAIESVRGETAAWLLIGVGFAYFIWGIRTAIKNKHNYYLTKNKSSKELITWTLFIIFVLGPCEPLIPLIMYPALQNSLLNIFLVTLVFSLSTLFVMVFMVLSLVYGARKIPLFARFNYFGNALAGFVICSCGLAIKFLGV